MAEPQFNILQKPPPEDDKKGWYRFHYKVCEILNNLLNTLPAWVFTVLTWPFTFTAPAQGDLITYDDASGQWINVPVLSVLNLYYGAMYCEDTTITVSVSANHTYYPVNSGLTDGGTSGFVFQNARELKCLTAGKYLVNWSLSLSSNQSDQTVEGLVMINTTGQVNVANATRAKENGVVYSVGATGVITLAVDDLVKLAVEKENGAAATLTVNHATLSLFRVSA